MHALAVTPAMPAKTVSAPTMPLAGNPSHSIAAYPNATCENAPKSSTSRLSQERRHIFSARYANTGRPRCIVEAPSANPPSANARRFAALGQSVVAHVALPDHATFRVVLRHSVRTIPCAVLTADASLGVVDHHSRDWIF